ncbi:phosphopantetheine-binding protein [Legionella anisa]|uniref:Phosphopantetheine-binding protein n=1 Tax=Legionella anisa TaxID=28082 RepID=A0AAX0WUN6_9GAMM|nr:phosphopantetheine-binding protein [Legionella anisa]AWN73940.1 phosphopantetheine-binding protein [Legionella anisa]KTC67208.1 Acyl carrier protein [Legionella anisa]MBN5936646.1 acyl carrier protein [Legionella anisa]MCW8426047.1 phosphopantetheine-binding protein [Legionella anisa]MCW8448516.1 phosphopantetheine-binding protein [Legionella anisa]
MSQQVQKRVLQVIAKVLTLSPENIQITQPINEICDDSLDLVNLVFTLEEEFNLDIADKVKEAKTVYDIIACIDTLVQQATENSAV